MRIPKEMNHKPQSTERGLLGWILLKWTWRATVFLTGMAMVMVGIVLLPLPGPFGTPVILLGIAILGSEFAWPRFVKERIMAWMISRKSRRSKPAVPGRKVPSQE